MTRLHSVINSFSPFLYQVSVNILSMSIHKQIIVYTFFNYLKIWLVTCRGSIEGKLVVMGEEVNMWSYKGTGRPEGYIFFP